MRKWKLVARVAIMTAFQSAALLGGCISTDAPEGTSVSTPTAPVAADSGASPTVLASDAMKLNDGECDRAKSADARLDKQSPCYAAMLVEVDPEPKVSTLASSGYRYRTASARWCLFQKGSANTQPLNGKGCFLAYARVSATFAFNESQRKVYVSSGPSCGRGDGPGYWVKKDWCGTWNNGGANHGYMNVGENFSVDTVISSIDRYIRLNADFRGAIWATGGML